MEVKLTNTQDIECAIRTILSFIGEDPCREGLRGTPDRIIRMWGEIFRGYDLSQVPKITGSSQMRGWPFLVIVLSRIQVDFIQCVNII